MIGSYGADQLGLSSLYNPLDFGTPLSLLQIPQAAITSISTSLSDPECHTASYTHDCLSVRDLERELTKADLPLVSTSNIDVGSVFLPPLLLFLPLSWVN